MKGWKRVIVVREDEPRRAREVDKLETLWCYFCDCLAKASSWFNKKFDLISFKLFFAHFIDCPLLLHKNWTLRSS